MIKKIIIGVITIIALFTGIIANPVAINDATERTVVQTISGDLFVQDNAGIYWAGFFSKRTKYPNNVTIQASTKENASPQADYVVTPYLGTFAEGDNAHLSHTVKWDLPRNKEQMINLHRTYANIDNLMTTTLLTYQNQTASFSTQRMSSEAHYSGGKSQLNAYFEDQLRNGQVLLITETKTRKLEDGSTKSYIEVRPKLNDDGTPRRNKSDIQTYGITASVATIDKVKYDDRIYEKLKAKIDAASDEATAKQQLITAQQEALTEKARGEKLIAQTKAREESAKLEAVIRAQKEAEVAEQELKRDKLKAASQLALKEAQAKGDKLKVAAGLTPQEKAEWDYKTKVGVAKELSKAQMPKIVINGGKQGGSANPLDAIGIDFLLKIGDKLDKK